MYFDDGRRLRRMNLRREVREMRCSDCEKDENNLRTCLNHPDGQPKLCNECYDRHQGEENK